MAIIIKNMTMPNDCFSCPLRQEDGDVCSFDFSKGIVDGEVPKWCPLEEVSDSQIELGGIALRMLIDRLEKKVLNGVEE